MKFALVGQSLSHSFSKTYFQDKFTRLGLSEFSYENLEFASESELIDSFPKIKERFQGINITIPYKKTLIPYLDNIDNTAKEIGAINCIAFKNGKSYGYNTDYLGFYDSIKKKTFSKQRQALILGNGGAAEAIKYVVSNLLEMPYRIADRKATDIDWAELPQLDLAQFSLIINTTPIGMSKNLSESPPIFYTSAVHDTLFVDLIYNPMITQYLEQADAHGFMIINGLPMLHNQAEYAWNIWTTQN